MKNKDLIIEYEDSLLGKKENISAYYFSYDSKYNEQIALELMRYAFETYLRWSPTMLRDHLNMQIINLLKLKPFLKYIKFPPELNPKEDLFFIAWKIYPDTIHLSSKDLILRVYQNLLDGKIQKFPKDYFLGIMGVHRANYCLNYMIEQYMQFHSVNELYKFFSTSAVSHVLKEYKLYAVCKDIFDSPLEYLHTSLPDFQRSQFLFDYYRFQQALRNLKEE